uniref:dihydrofolate reductase n=1 Tax=Amphilophus citrinellus TaxID=61819 RepID=A0A3Q0RFK0_AMPCI
MRLQKKPVRLIAAVCNEPNHNVNAILFCVTGRMNLMIWGRLCWNSFPESDFPLANILHVVLSKTLDSSEDICIEYLSECQHHIAGKGNKIDALNHPWCDLLYLTDIMADFDCDVFFPEFDKNRFQLQEGFPGVPSEIQEENGIKYKYQVFKRDTADTV